MSITCHGEFCHQYFDTFVTNIPVSKGRRANISQMFFFLLISFCHKVSSFHSAFWEDSFEIFNNKHFYLFLKTRELKFGSSFYRISPWSYWVSYVKHFLQFDCFKSYKINLKASTGPSFKKYDLANLIKWKTLDFSISDLSNSINRIRLVW